MKQGEVQSNRWITKWKQATCQSELHPICMCQKEPHEKRSADQDTSAPTIRLGPNRWGASCLGLRHPTTLRNKWYLKQPMEHITRSNSTISKSLFELLRKSNNLCTCSFQRPGAWDGQRSKWQGNNISLINDGTYLFVPLLSNYGGILLLGYITVKSFQLLIWLFLEAQELFRGWSYLGKRQAVGLVQGSRLASNSKWWRPWCAGTCPPQRP